MNLYTKSKCIYISPEIKDVDNAFTHPLLYCLCISKASPFVLEILFLRDLTKDFNIKKNYFIIGIALTKKSATKAIATIVEPFFKSSGTCLKDYLFEIYYNL